MKSILKVIKNKKNPEDSLNQGQRTFNQLKKTIEKLQRKEKTRVLELDQCLQLYHSKIYPEEQELLNALTERIKLVYKFLKTKKMFSKEEKPLIKVLIQDDIDLIFQMQSPQHVSSEIKDIFKEISGHDYLEIISDVLDKAKSDIEEMFKKQGVDINLSDIKSTDNEEDILKNFYERIHTVIDENEQNFSSKQEEQQLPEKEQKQRKFEEIQKRSINVIYKQLVKILHPDLEQDPEKKLEKESLMKKLTVAYENCDLYTLLSLEIEWIHSDKDTAKIKSNEQMRIYNSMLKEQIIVLQTRINSLFLEPNYFCLQRFFNDKFTGIIPLYRYFNDLTQDKILTQKINIELQSSKNPKDIIMCGLMSRIMELG